MAVMSTHIPFVSSVKVSVAIHGASEEVIYFCPKRYLLYDYINWSSLRVHLFH